MQDQQTHDSQGERSESRVTIELEAIVQVKESDGGSWKEMVTVTSISRNGAGFYSPRRCGVGCLVAIVLPMPEELRAYDRSKELYPVMGLVQYCTENSSEAEIGYNIGVALIGKKAPESYTRNPEQAYRINGMSKNAFWTVTEADSTFRPRKYPRYMMSLEVGVSLLRKETRSVVKNTAITRDLGIGGAAIKCSLDANVGDKVKFAYEKLGFYALAIVRNREDVEGEDPILRLEFLENHFPVEKLHLVKDQRIRHEPADDEVLIDSDEIIDEEISEDVLPPVDAMTTEAEIVRL